MFVPLHHAPVHGQAAFAVALVVVSGIDQNAYVFAFAFLANPWKLWDSRQLTLQRTVLRLGFSERPRYSRNHGLRTPEKALLFNILEGNQIQE